jgi:hypothetical protein
MDMTRVSWRKSSYSGNTGDNCVEVGSVSLWRKSRHSGNNGGNCVEVGAAPCAVAVRDSKDPDGARLAFTPARWQEFTRRVKDAAAPA